MKYLLGFRAARNASRDPGVSVEGLAQRRCIDSARLI
jgi:hypothetical protein